MSHIESIGAEEGIDAGLLRLPLLFFHPIAEPADPDASIRLEAP